MFKTKREPQPSDYNNQKKIKLSISECKHNVNEMKKLVP